MLLTSDASEAFASHATCFILKIKSTDSLLKYWLYAWLKRQAKRVEYVFRAQKYWQSNVNFQSCLEKFV